MSSFGEKPRVILYLGFSHKLRAMPTPMRMTTPRRLFSPKVVVGRYTPGGTKRTGFRALKRRRIGTIRTKGKPKTVRDIVQEIAQTKRKRTRILTPPPVFEANATLIGNNIMFADGTGGGALPALDAPDSARESQVITLTGIALKGHFRSVEPVVATGVVLQPPTTLRWYLCTTSRADNPLNYWYQEINKNNNLPYNVFTEDGLGDCDRIECHMNLLDIKILARGQYKVAHSNFATEQHNSRVLVNRFIKLNMKIHYNTAKDDTPPYTEAMVRPNIWFIMCVQNANPLLVGPSAASTVETTGRINLTTYWRE